MPFSIVDRVTSIRHREDDSRSVQTRKTTLVVTTIIGAIVVIPWGILYMSIGLVLTGMIPIFYAIVSAIGIVHLRRTRDDRFLRYEQIALFFLLPALIHDRSPIDMTTWPFCSLISSISRLHRRSSQRTSWLMHSTCFLSV